MKISNFLLILFYCYLAQNIHFLHCLGIASKIKQDAITSLVIFAKSQADFQSEKHQTILNRNFTFNKNDEIVNLLKLRKANYTIKHNESIKNSTIHHNSTIENTNKIVYNKLNSTVNNHTNSSILNYRKDNIVKKDNYTMNNSLKTNLRKKKVTHLNDTKLKNISIPFKNFTLIKNNTNSSINQNKTDKMNKTNYDLHASIHNKKLIML